MRVPIAIEPGSETTAFGVIVPGLPGCFSAGDTLDEAYANAVQAIELWMEVALERQQAVPIPNLADLARHQNDPDLAGWLWGIVDVDLSKLGNQTAHVDIELPRPLLQAVDAYAQQQGETRNGFLIRAALDQLQREAADTRESRSPSRPTS